MKDYINIVISIIDINGKEINVEVNERYHKHIQPFKAAAKNHKNLQIEKYIEKRGTDNITGYDIASFLGAEGSVVFFHTDVSNYKMNKKEGSIIIPKLITNSQKIKLKKLIENLEEEKFKFYVTQSKFKKNSSYRLVRIPLNLALLKKLVYNVDIIKGEDEICKKTI